MAAIEAGTPLRILIRREDGKKKTITLASTLVAYGENNRLLITEPMLDQQAVHLGAGQTVMVVYYDNSDVISFSAAMVQIVRRSERNYFMLEQTSDFRRVQRRENFRLDCLLDGHLEYLDADGKVIMKCDIIVRDISGGGASLRSPVFMAVGTPVLAYLPLGEGNEMIRYQSEIRRSFRLEDSVTHLCYNLGIKFLFQNERQREALIAKIFSMERERMSART